MTIEKDEDPKSYEDQRAADLSKENDGDARMETMEEFKLKAGIRADKMIMPGPWRPPVPAEEQDRRNRKTAIKLMELAIDLLREHEPVYPYAKPRYETHGANKLAGVQTESAPTNE